ncbi:MAG: DEAD/DEAH box helicase [Cryobacterium sp.]|nr:DEAD/DEAH box helicase [Cryobacterium sp.]
MIAEFQSSLPFALDPFQLAACRALEQGQSVLVAAPTGSGKTIVAQFAVHLTMRTRASKVFYTTPIKALSNQKFQELTEIYGEADVGLLTGDSSINSGARIVVMTTEVLRNMLYADSDLLPDLQFVVMDEVHYLADRMRGAVWEEVIIHLPKTVRLVSLSATVSNAEEFGDWLQSVRGETAVIVSEDRPVPLTQHVLIRDSLIELFSRSAKGDSNRINPELQQLTRMISINGTIGSARRGRSRPQPRMANFPRTDRAGAIRLLESRGLLPAIYFIFSRAGCDAAVEGLLRRGIKLTDRSEREEIRRIVEERCDQIPGEDLQVLGYREWLAGLERGIASHHAGMIPVFKETVEELFGRKLVKVVFATETLALGVNMPARTVVLEKLEKFNGESRVPITAGEFTQLTGRAGRRGIDDHGHSVVQWQPGMEPTTLAALASRRTYPLISSFRPGYNMAVNLISEFGAEQSRRILESSFAQFQADRAVVDLAQKVRGQEESLAGYAKSMNCHLGDFAEFARLRHELSELEKSGSRRKKVEKSQERSKRLAEIAKLRSKIKQHPCNSCPEREAHSRWAERWFALKRQTDSLRKHIDSRTGAISRAFDRIIEVLEELGYLKLENSQLRVTASGQSLRKIYSERDLLVAECIRGGAWSELDPAGLAAMAAAIVYEPRRESESAAIFELPSGSFRKAFKRTLEAWEALSEVQERHRLDPDDPPIATLSIAMSNWARGVALESILLDAEMAAGDFVRVTKQTIDLLDQISKLDEDELGRTARKALNSIDRGLVAWTGVN